MLILTAEEMRAIDRATTERFGIASIDLMRNAGQAVARFVEREFPDYRASPCYAARETTAATVL